MSRPQTRPRIFRTKLLDRADQMRIDQKLTFKALAKRAGYDPSHVIRWLRGTHRIRLLDLDNVLEALGYKLIIVPISFDESLPLEYKGSSHVVSVGHQETRP